MNPGNGRILITRCTLKCPVNSTCAFEKPVPNMEAKQFCQCMNGKKTYVDGNCNASDLSCKSLNLLNIIDFIYFSFG